jgi:hypothetical protein
MPAKLNEKTVRLIEPKNFTFLATLLPNRLTHFAPACIDNDGDLVLVNTAMSRVKQQNTAKDPRASISIAEQNNMYESIINESKSAPKIASGSNREW